MSGTALGEAIKRVKGLLVDPYYWVRARTPDRINRTDKARYHALAKRLKAARKESALSQTTVGRMMGRNQLWVMRAEASGRISFVALERLAAIYGKPLSYFQTLEPAVRSEDKYLGFTNQQWKRTTGKPGEESMPRKKTSPREALEDSIENAIGSNPTPETLQMVLGVLCMEIVEAVDTLNDLFDGEQKEEAVKAAAAVVADSAFEKAQDALDDLDEKLAAGKSRSEEQ